MMKWVTVLVIAVALLESVTAFSRIPMNRVSNVTFDEQHNEMMKRSNNPLGGGFSIIGFYFVRLQVGLQTFRVNIDTGSSNLFIVGSECHFLDDRSKACEYAESYYKGLPQYQGCLDTCTDCQESTCIINVKYGDGSQVWSATVLETVSIGGYSANSVPVGVSYLQSTGFASQGGKTYMDGLWGLGYPALSGVPTVLESLVDDGGMPNIFSICLNYDGGYLVLGGIDAALHTGAVQYTPVVKKSYYTVAVVNFLVDTTSIGASFGDVIVDTGATFTHLPSNAYNKLKLTLQSEAPTFNPQLFMAVGEDIHCAAQVLAGLPDITIRLGGNVDLVLKPNQYLIQCSAGYAFAFIPTGDSLTIIGDTVLVNYYSVYDRVNDRVGFAPVSEACSASVPLNNPTPPKVVPGGTSRFHASHANIFTPSFISMVLCIGLAIFLF